MIPIGPIANENTDLPFQDTTWNLEPNKKQLETQLMQGPKVGTDQATQKHIFLGGCPAGT